MKYLEVVCAVIKSEENKIFVCKRGPGRVLNGMWEFPGGKIERNEKKEDALLREIKEELDSTILIKGYIGSVYYEYATIDNPFSLTLHAFDCVLLKGDLTLSEHIDSRFISIDELETIDFAMADYLLINKIKKYYKNI